MAGGEALVDQVAAANTALEVIELAQENDVALGDLVAKRAKEVARAVVSGHCDVEVICINRKGEIVGHAR